ncbi:MAG: hypothetical protein KDE14_01500 [Rhodobacteraceae bacterium]|nr:hypothetical protein [Paracoccaceae bacterium]
MVRKGKRAPAAPYQQIYEGEWVQPAMRGFVHACCGCALVHVLDFKVMPGGRGAGRVQFRTRIDRRLTAAARRANKKGR